MTAFENEKKIDAKDIRKRFEKWLYRGKYTQDGLAFDVGKTCYKAIMGKKGLDDFYSNGNGSLMRIIPLAFVENITDQQITEVS